MPEILAFVPDIFFQARIAETARRVAIRVAFAPTLDAFLKAVQAGAETPNLLILDLNATDGSDQNAALSALERLRATGNQTPAVAFLSHVQHELAARAAAFANTEVMPRSKVTQDLVSILTRAKS